MRVLSCGILVFLVAIAPLLGGERGSKGSAATTAPGRGGSAPEAARGRVETPDDIVRAKWPAVIEVLQNQGLDAAGKEKEIERIVSPIIDFVLMSKLALGKAHWTRLTAPQRERYLQLFVARLKQSYREKIALYEGEKILVKFPPRGTSAAKAESSKTVHVPIELTTKGKQAIVVHKFRQDEKQWKLYDAEIEGVSILLTYRSQFSDILRTGTVEDLLKQLEKEPPR